MTATEAAQIIIEELERVTHPNNMDKFVYKETLEEIIDGCKSRLEAAEMEIEDDES